MTFIKSFLKTILYKPLFNALVFFIWLIPGNNVGIAIIILTIIIRLILLPSSAKAIKAQKQLKDLQPALEKIKEKYKDNKEGQAKATMAFYQQNKINPFSSCLPLLIQFPVLIILYYVFRAGLDTSRFDELLYSFTPVPEAVNTIFLGVDLAQPSIYLAIIAGLFQFIQARQMTLTSSKTKDKKEGQAKEQKTGDMIQESLGKQMTYLMPIFTVIIAMKLPAALAVYWIVTTIFAVIQQWWIFKKAPLDKSSVSVTVKNR